MLPYTKLKIWGQDLPYYYNLGVKGVYNEHVKSWAITGASDYLEVKMLWNVNSDWRKVLKKLLSKGFW